MMVTANQLHVSASNRPSSGCTYKEMESHCILYSPHPFSLYLQPDDGLLGAETCSWLAVTIIRSIRGLLEKYPTVFCYANT